MTQPFCSNRNPFQNKCNTALKVKLMVSIKSNCPMKMPAPRLQEHFGQFFRKYSLF